MKKLNINARAYRYYSECPVTQLIQEIRRSKNLLPRMALQSSRYPGLYTFSKKRIELLLTILRYRCDQITRQEFQQRVSITPAKRAKERD